VAGPTWRSGPNFFVSLSTVKSHVSTIQMKLGLRNRTEVAVWAWENRIVETT
jgi:DNA-binding NarL/FixJ family response regulator